MHAVTDGQGMLYVVRNMCMWNKDGHKVKIEKDRRKARANKNTT
jgi:hypothetical protein